MTEQRVLQPRGRMPDWRTVNIDPAERLTRIAVGAGVVIVGLLGLITTGSVLATALGGLFVLIGLHLVITGALGHCPLYAELGHTRRSQKQNHMTAPRDDDPPVRHLPTHPGHAPTNGHGGHGWLMIACCIPMLAIAAVLVATGVLSVSFLFLAVLCTVMMAMMMRGMGGPRDTTPGSGAGLTGIPENTRPPAGFTDWYEQPTHRNEMDPPVGGRWTARTGRTVPQ